MSLLLLQLLVKMFLLFRELMKQFNPATQHIISLGSCTTNAIIPLIKLLHDTFGIAQGAMTDRSCIHEFTSFAGHRK